MTEIESIKMFANIYYVLFADILYYSPQEVRRNFQQLYQDHRTFRLMSVKCRSRNIYRATLAQDLHDA